MRDAAAATVVRPGPSRAPLREVSAVGRVVVTADRHDGERTRLTKNSPRYVHALAHNLRVCFEAAALPHEHSPFSENAPKQPFQKDNSLLDTHSTSV